MNPYAIVWMLAGRLWHNRKLVAMSLLGFIITVAVVCSIPIFADGALQRILATELGRDETKGRQPAALNFSYFSKEGEPPKVTAAAYDDLHRYMTGPALGLLPFKPDPFLHYAALDVTGAEPVDPAHLDPTKGRWVKVAAVENLPALVKTMDGRLFNPGKTADGMLEAVITEGAAMDLELTVGAELLVPVARGNDYSPKVKVRVVGIVPNPLPGQPLFYISGFLDGALLIDQPTFRKEVLALPEAIPGQYTYYLGLKATDINLANLDPFIDGMYTVEARTGQILQGTRLAVSPRDELQRFARKGFILRLMLLVLSVPLLALVGYYLLVTASLTVDGQRSEIAVLRSRGAAMGQIVGIYLLEGLLFATLALLVGPPLGLLIAKAMGAAAGFVQFVDRKPLVVAITARTYLYGAAAAGVALLATLIPAAQAARESIVTFRQQQARAGRQALWHRFFLDIVLIALSLYGWYTLTRQAATHGNTPQGPGAGPEMLIDPLHFLLPAVLIAGTGLLLLRLLPVLTRLLERVTRHRAGAPLHLALTQVSRSPGSTAPVVLLLTLTVGLGLYSAAAARTLEGSYADRIYYKNGADVVLDEVWEYDEETGLYHEPPWGFHAQTPGVASAARVRITTRVSASAGGKPVGTGSLMAIVPPEFARTAWYRRDLSPYHINAYANLLAKDEEAVLVTPRFLSKHKLVPGDSITLSESGREVTLVIYGAVAYWPGLASGQSDFFVANLDYVQEQMGLKPYQTWLRMTPNATLTPLYDRLSAEHIPLLRASDARVETALARRDPQRTGVYGALTIGFIVSAGLTVLGFLLYAVLSLRSRLLQLGVLRAMGLSIGQLLTALGLEQVYTVGVGLLAGTASGLLAARLYLPLLQLSADLADGLLPFRIVTDPVDRVRLYAVLGVMLLAGFLSLGAVIRSMQIHQAVKLGEDA